MRITTDHKDAKWLAFPILTSSPFRNHIKIF